MAIISGDVQYTQNRTFNNPWNHPQIASEIQDA